MSASDSTVLVGTVGKKVFIKVEGKGTHLNSPTLREFISEMIEQGYRDFELDLLNCTYMDSTFLGMLVGVTIRLKNMSSSRFGVSNISQRNLELLETLGVAQFFAIASHKGQEGAGASPGLQALPQGQTSKQEHAETMLEAHETLVRADESNVPRFKDCIQFLKEDVARIKAQKGDASDSSSPPGNQKP